MKKIELLSPAKDVEVGMAAINHGADAVYIGGPDFGAREKPPIASKTSNAFAAMRPCMMPRCM